MPPENLGLLPEDDPNHDRVVNKSAGLTITGTGETGTTITLFDDRNHDNQMTGDELLATTVVSNSSWVADIALSQGHHAVKAIQTDSDGHNSTPSLPLHVTVRTPLFYGDTLNTAPTVTKATGSPTLSADGQWLVFHSTASNLTSGDNNNSTDIFAQNRTNNDVMAISVDSSGLYGNAGSYTPSVSGQGSLVVFASDATNLVDGDSNGQRDIFLRDLATNTTTRISIASSNTQANNDSLSPSLSTDGRSIAFVSEATNLVANDSNGRTDIFVRDLQANTTLGVTLQGNGDSDAPVLSADGRFVAFTSKASNLVTNDTNGRTDIFVYDRMTNAFSRVNISSGGEQGNGDANTPALSADGRFVVFSSSARNLVTNDSNNSWDIFVHDRLLKTTALVSLNDKGEQGNGGSYMPMLSPDGSMIGFESFATNLIPDDINGQKDTLILANPFSAVEIPTSLDLDTAGDSGFSSSDNITHQTSGLVIRGRGKSGSSILLFDDLNHNLTIDEGETVAITTVTDNSWQTTISLSNGTHPLMAMQTDGTGSISFSTETLSILVDATPPVATFLAPATATVAHNQLPAIHGSAVDQDDRPVTTVQLKIFDQTSQTYWIRDGNRLKPSSQETWNSTDPAVQIGNTKLWLLWLLNTGNVWNINHSYQLTVRAEDQAGNLSDPVTTSFGYTVDGKKVNTRIRLDKMVYFIGLNLPPVTTIDQQITEVYQGLRQFQTNITPDRLDQDGVFH
ncbi:MAG: PD40 domain-containing protein [Magnetococcales bacterium]|nr:PD40 domain-containing protein [Magnetococcales bacterium]